MKRNHSMSPFFRLPPELRVRIFGLVLGGQQVWISHSKSRVEWRKTEKGVWVMGPHTGHSGQYYHRWGNLHHAIADSSHSTNPFNNTLHLGLLRVSRQIYSETALLPYALNTFTFQDDSVRRLFEQSARQGKKRVQKKAIGKYEIGTWSQFRNRHIDGQQKGRLKP